MGDDLITLKILRLESHCLICQKQTLRIGNNKSPLTNKWKKSCGDSICQSLRITEKPICSVWFKRAAYCQHCYELFCDFEFIEKSIQRLQKRLDEITETAVDLILKNVQDLDSSTDKIGDEYFRAVKFIGNELKLRCREKFTDDIEDFHSTKSQRSSDSDAISVKEEEEVDSENIDLPTEPKGKGINQLRRQIENEDSSDWEPEPNEDPLGIPEESEPPQVTRMTLRHRPHILRRRLTASSSRPGTSMFPITRDARVVLPQISTSLNLPNSLPFRRIVPAPFAGATNPALPPRVPPPPVPVKPPPAEKSGPLKKKPLLRRHLRIEKLQATLRGMRASGSGTTGASESSLPSAINLVPLGPLRRIAPAAPFILAPTGVPLILPRPAPVPTSVLNPAKTTVAPNRASTPASSTESAQPLQLMAPLSFSGTTVPILPLSFFFPNLVGGNLICTSTNTSTAAALNTTVSAPTKSFEVIDVEIISDKEAPSVSIDIENSGTNSIPTDKNSSQTSKTSSSKLLPISKTKRPRKSIPCTYPNCKYVTNERRLHCLARHILQVHEKDPQPFRCAECENKFKTRQRLDTHIKCQHIDRVSCPICPNLSLSSKSYLRIHMVECHPEGVKPKCKICSKICSDKTELETHEALHNDPAEDETVLPCVFCTSIFSSRLELSRHVHKEHEDEYRKFNCDTCDAKFFTHGKRLAHYRSQHKIRNEKYKCTAAGCTFIALNLRGFKQHQATHTNCRTLKCNHPNCHKKFKRKSTLELHLAMHAVNDKLIEPKFTCGVCSRGFAEVRRYILHMKSHNNLRPFLCDQCPMAYKNMSALAKHAWKHSLHEHAVPELGVSNSQVHDKITDDSNKSQETNEALGDSCAVCGDTGSLGHLGSVTACMACRVFFEYHEGMKYAGNTIIQPNVKPTCDTGNCTITPQTKGNCKDCRLKKCFTVGMTFKPTLKRRRDPFRHAGAPRRRSRKGTSNVKPEEKAAQDTSSKSVVVKQRKRVEGECPICCFKDGPLVSACGIDACSNCRTFFVHAMQRQRVFRCAGNNNCQFTAERDVYCSSCRMQRCIAAGMKTEEVPPPPPSIFGKCHVCEREDTSLKKSMHEVGVYACRLCSHNFWVAVKNNRPKTCLKAEPCGNISNCFGCRWVKFIQVGFKPDMVKEMPSKKTEIVPNDAICSVCGDTGKHKKRDKFLCGSCTVFFCKITKKGTTPICTKGGNCTIEILTRNDCAACRLQKCYEVGIPRRIPYEQRVERIRPTEFCKICGDTSVGNRYGVQCCESCCFFFIKKRERDLGECQLEDNCEITKETRTKCHPCRFAKCVEIGMKKPDRWGKIPKNSSEAQALRHGKLITETTTTAPENIIYEPIEIELESIQDEDQGIPYSQAVPSNEW